MKSIRWIKVTDLTKHTSTLTTVIILMSRKPEQKKDWVCLIFDVWFLKNSRKMPAISSNLVRFMLILARFAIFREYEII